MEHFRLEQVTPTAWAAVAVPDTGAVGNAGIVKAGSGTIVFDTFVTPQAARDLRRAAEAIAPVAYVVNSHWHGDHVRGNMAFDDATIVATTRTRELIEENALPAIAEMKQMDPQPFLDAGGTEAEIAKTIAELEQVLPTDVFDEAVDLAGVTVESLGGGHTASDAFLTLDDVIFAGDLVVVANHPWVGHGDPERWLEILDAIEERVPRAVVPGHGPVGTLDDVRALRRYIETLLADPDRGAEPGWAYEQMHERNAAFVRERAAA